jgi:Glycosyl hydrolases family 2, sugar binding domain/Glycosyl hydrolases family 2/Glycosyl hydrolases family 2, TIM barrel domain
MKHLATFLLSSLTILRAAELPKPADGLAQIANESVSNKRETLLQPLPPELPETALPWAAEIQPFTPQDKLDTPEKLAAELARQRERHAPFLADLAPKLPQTRIIVPITSFDWRIETAQDRADFLGTLTGQGDWKRVSIPHYDAPIGLATTYYRTTFEVTRAMLDKGAAFVRFAGVDYKAKVFVNGAFVGSHEGFFAPFEFDCTANVRLGTNTLLVKVENDWPMHNFAAHRGEKIWAFTGPGFDNPKVGWQHCPPAMGIYQSVSVEARPRMQVHDIFVRPLPEQSRAEAWIEVFSCDVNEPNLILELAVYGQNFQQTVFTGAMTDGLGKLTCDGKRPELTEKSPKVSRGLNYFRIPFDTPAFRYWSPSEPWLYQIQVTLRDATGKILDTRKRQFGMRSFRMDTASDPKGRLFLNGQPIRLRGANTMGFEQQDVMRGDLDRLRDDILLAKICNLNFLRLTQRPVQDEIYEWCDRLGLMTQTDLPLSWVLRRSQFAEAVRQAEEMERLVRAHPCNIMVTYINEPQPNGWGHPHRNLSRPELESFFLAADQAVHLANPDRVIKAVDGDSDPPGPGLPDMHCYAGWYNEGGALGKVLQGYWRGVKPGWLYACGEFGVEGLDSVETMRRRYPAEWLPATPAEERTWTPSRIPDAQTGKFHYLWFDTQHSLADWATASQAHQAKMIRLMTEAFRRDRRMVSCAVHLFIDAFPASWLKSIMDVDRNPKPAFYAYRDALEPIAANLYSPRNAFFSGDPVRVAAWICNDRNQGLAGASLRYQAECQGRILRTGTAAAIVASDDSVFQGWLAFDAPLVSERTNLTVRLQLVDGSGRPVHDTEQTFDLFPPPTVLERQDIVVLGPKTGKAAKLAEELGLNPIFTGVPVGQRLILIDDPATLAASTAEVTAAVRAGARAVCIEWPAGSYTLAGDAIAITNCADGPRLFVSRATGHPLVQGFAPDDFKLWCDAKEKGIRPLLSTLFTAPGGWQAVLLSGQEVSGRWGPALAAAEKVDGRGSWVLCQLQLQGRLKDNPVARLFAQRLVQVEDEVDKNLPGLRTKTKTPSSSHE